MEKRDLYNEKRQLVGKAIDYLEKVPEGMYYITVVIWIQNSNEEFLLQKTSLKKHHMWATTGGHPKSGETSLEGIVREVKEELGLRINPEELVLFKTIKTDDDFVDLYYLKHDFDLNLAKLQSEEVESVMWASYNVIEDLIRSGKFLPPHIEFYKDCLKYINK